MNKIFIAMAMLICIGCKMKIASDEVVGSYVANHKMGIDYLVIERGGAYKYNYIGNDGRRINHSGKWEMVDETRIGFEDFAFGIPGYGNGAPGFWNVEVELHRGCIRLCIDPDMNYYYERQER